MIPLTYILIGLMVTVLADSNNDLCKGWQRLFAGILLTVLWLPIAIACWAWSVMDQ